MLNFPYRMTKQRGREVSREKGFSTVVSIYNDRWTDSMSTPITEPRPEDDADRVLDRTEVGLALSRAGFGDVHVLSHEAADRALTRNRRELIQVIDSQDVASIRDLARRIDRDTGNVKRDLDVLVAENIVAFHRDGRAKRPYVKPDTIVQEPVVSESVGAAAADGPAGLDGR